ncbi:MAG: hypothetical protein IJY28_10090 [Clostridia bacterium]|nr:hypothetical protein [Clostridia bacterium]
MKKFFMLILLIFLVVTLMFFWEGYTKGRTDYLVTKKDFYYSEDNGNTYGNRRIKFEVGREIYMQLQIEVETNVSEVEELQVSLKIPNVNAVDAYYYSGQKITPVRDNLNGVTIYTFTIATNDTSLFFFKFVPTSPSVVQMELDFADPVPARYDSINTIEFVTSK